MYGAGGAVGGRYVIPMALWRPVRSRFAGMNATVASPCSEADESPGIWKRIIEDGFSSENMGSACTFSGGKYFQLRIFFAAPGSARMRVRGRDGGS